MLQWPLNCGKINNWKGCEFMNQLAIFWIIAAVVFAIIELVTNPLICIWFCGGALVAAVLSFFVDSIWISASVFVVVSALLLVFTRPVVNKKLSPKKVATNADRIIGKKGIVIQKIDPVENKGQIKVEGQVWSAKCEEYVDEGTAVKVASIEGVKAVVNK